MAVMTVMKMIVILVIPITIMLTLVFIKEIYFSLRSSQHCFQVIELRLIRTCFKLAVSHPLHAKLLIAPPKVAYTSLQIFRVA